MKLHKFADRKKEMIAIVLISIIVVGVSIYVVSLVNGLTEKVYRVFGRPASTNDTSGHFDFKAFEALGLRPATTSGSSTVPSVPATTTAPVLPAGSANPASSTTATSSVPTSTAATSS